MANSVGNSMVAGTISDMYRAKSRGLTMNVFSLVIYTGQALGPIVCGFIGQALGVQWAFIVSPPRPSNSRADLVQIQTMLAAVSCVVNALVIRETRGDVLLSRRAKRLTIETGVKHLAAADLQKKSIFTLMTVSLVRPLSESRSDLAICC